MPNIVVELQGGTVTRYHSDHSQVDLRVIDHDLECLSEQNVQERLAHLGSVRTWVLPSPDQPLTPPTVATPKVTFRRAVGEKDVLLAFVDGRQTCRLVLIGGLWRVVRLGEERVELNNFLRLRDARTYAVQRSLLAWRLWQMERCL